MTAEEILAFPLPAHSTIFDEDLFRKKVAFGLFTDSDKEFLLREVSGFTQKQIDNFLKNAHT
jgi:hypothetical protein